MIRNKLKINDSKTEFLIITSSFLTKSFDDLSIRVGDSNVSSNSVRNLGVIFDKCIKLDYNISSVCKSTFFHLRNIGGIRSILSNDACAQLIHSLVTVRLDYCNSILYGLSDVVVIVGPTPPPKIGRGVQQPFLRTPADGIPLHLAGIRARWSTGAPLLPNSKPWCRHWPCEYRKSYLTYTIMC